MGEAKLGCLASDIKRQLTFLQLLSKHEVAAKREGKRKSAYAAPQ